MSYILNHEASEAIFSELQKTYTIYAPKRIEKAGRFSDTDLIQYGEVHSFDEIVFDKKSTFPMKEVINPIQQTLFYYTEEEFRESSGPKKKILCFGRPCDINAQKIQARIYDGKGGFIDPYYKRLEDVISYALMECPQDSDSCFCVSMKTNKTDNYVFAIKETADGLKIEVKDNRFEPYFHGAPTTDYKVSFPESNELTLTVPTIPSKEVQNELKKHDVWKQFNSRCISCGACTIGCSTCTCFTTRDVVYTENDKAGERRRVSASCQVPGFDQMAMQKEFRSTAGDRIRYRVLHKFHDYDARFHEGHMCVGCGRCSDRCPAYIEITSTVNKMAAAIEDIKAKGE